jgi:hypothetical protein
LRRRNEDKEGKDQRNRNNERGRKMKGNKTENKRV